MGLVYRFVDNRYHNLLGVAIDSGPNLWFCDISLFEDCISYMLLILEDKCSLFVVLKSQQMVLNRKNLFEVSQSDNYGAIPRLIIQTNTRLDLFCLSVISLGLV